VTNEKCLTGKSKHGLLLRTVRNTLKNLSDDKMYTFNDLNKLFKFYQVSPFTSVGCNVYRVRGWNIEVLGVKERMAYHVTDFCDI
jgi:hypothetical protein